MEESIDLIEELDKKVFDLINKIRVSFATEPYQFDIRPNSENTGLMLTLLGEFDLSYDTTDDYIVLNSGKLYLSDKQLKTLYSLVTNHHVNVLYNTFREIEKLSVYLDFEQQKKYPKPSFYDDFVEYRKSVCQ